MNKWRCTICGYIYDPGFGDPDAGIGSGVMFEELPDSWGCPECGSSKEFFEPYEEEEY